ncbi:MAG: coenzyme F420-0:L-glutamate ligase [Candidatus Methylomirabilis oxyfera]|nr:coenzyme F420-0:L-glutamate ligase [Candidatus Methylomirabilis oxyfera]
MRCCIGLGSAGELELGRAPELTLIGLTGIPEIQVGDDLAALLVEAATRLSLAFQPNDILVVTQKVVSKIEGRVVCLRDVTPSPASLGWAAYLDKDPRLVELILGEATRIVRMDQGLLLAETRHGFICANAGVDRSNLPGEESASLLPLDPDSSAEAIRNRIRALCGADVAILISDTFGRPWRDGLTNVAIGVSGLIPLQDYRGTTDDFDRPLKATRTAIADELAAAAELVMGKTERIPAVLIRGYRYVSGEGRASMLLRPSERDLFR